MNAREGFRRLSLAFGIIGLCVGLAMAYGQYHSDVERAIRATVHVEHDDFGGTLLDDSGKPSLVSDASARPPISAEAPLALFPAFGFMLSWGIASGIFWVVMGFKKPDPIAQNLMSN